MFIEIQSRNVALTGSLRTHIRRRLNFVLSNKAGDIQRVRVWLEEKNCQGNDKTCRLQLLLRHMPGFVIEDTEADLDLAIDRAAHRAGNTIGRKLARLRHMSGMPA